MVIFVILHAIEQRLLDNVASMAWKLHAIEQMQLRGARRLISTQAMEEKELALMRRRITADEAPSP